MIALRLLIGLFEAGFYPTAVGYLSTFYTRFDLAIRVGIFYGQYAIAGAFSGALCKCWWHSAFVTRAYLVLTWQTVSVRHLPN